MVDEAKKEDAEFIRAMRKQTMLSLNQFLFGIKPLDIFGAKCKKCGEEPRVQHHCDEFHCEAPLIEREIA